MKKRWPFGHFFIYNAYSVLAILAILVIIVSKEDRGMWMRRAIIALLAVILCGFAGYGIYHYVRENKYSDKITAAEKAVEKKDWQNAKKNYKAAQSVKMTPVTRTSIEQLNHAIKAVDATKDKNYVLAKSQYEVALDVDDGNDKINKSIENELADVKVKDRSETKEREASEKRASEASAASEQALQASYAYADSIEVAAKSAKESSERAKSKRHASNKKQQQNSNSNRSSSKKSPQVTR